MTAETCKIMEPFGPVYPALPSVAKFRRMANGRELTKEEGRAYGRAVCQAIRDLQRVELIGRSAELTHKPPTMGQILAGTYPMCQVPASHDPKRLKKLPHKGGMHEPKNWDVHQRSRYEAAMAETRAAREAQEAKRLAEEAVKVEAPLEVVEVVEVVEAASNVIEFVPTPAPVAPAKPASAFVRADGSFDRAAIMREAHSMAREMRTINPGKAYKDHLSEAMRAVWANAKNAAPVRMAA